jgi:hypothetical protein
MPNVAFLSPLSHENGKSMQTGNRENSINHHYLLFIISTLERIALPAKFEHRKTSLHHLDRGEDRLPSKILA